MHLLRHFVSHDKCCSSASEVQAQLSETRTAAWLNRESISIAGPAPTSVLGQHKDAADFRESC